MNLTHAQVTEKALKEPDRQMSYLFHLQYELAPPSPWYRRLWYRVTHFRRMPRWVPRKTPILNAQGTVKIRVPSFYGEAK